MVKLVTKVERVLPGVKFVGGKASIGNVNLVWGRDGKSIILYSTTVRHVQGRLDISMSADAIKGTMRRVHEASEIFDKIINDKRMKGVELIDTLYITRNYVNAAVKVGEEFRKLFYRDISIGGKFLLTNTDKVYSGKNKPYKITQKKKKKEEVKSSFDYNRFSAYITLVESLRPTYKGLRDYLRTAHKAGMIKYERIDLDNKEDTLDLLIQAARRMSLEEKKDRKYPPVIEDRRKAISTVIKKKGKERKESAKAGSSLPSEFQVEEYKENRI